MNVRSNTNMQKFKGVVPQQNGHWGAQIYANHQRIWLGTFKSEREAAMAYDSATIKLRSGESHRNFPWNDQTVQEPLFQSHYTTKAVLSMIRDGTYPSKLASFLLSRQTLTLTLNGEEQITRARKNVEEKFSYNQLFQKELTPSDVGKLNRLVIPKKHASRYFPYASGTTEEADSNNNYGTTMDINSDIELVFYDKLMRSWKFRYCYWRSSQSFVFTRGWNRFVKDKRLKAKDVIVFYKCEPIIDRRIINGGEVFHLIDVIYDEDNVHESSRTSQCFGEKKRDYRQSFGKMLSFNNRTEEDEEDDDDENETENGKKMLHSPTDAAKKGLKLFGVRIN
ncbi:AP2/ERF and B3 domain-containing transcription factor At1g51120 [Prosopis cineraria]|uniref:AP2/ERF and B3 domain-containing transcription factor At1g51120 n=1 Tax=Prosopis cineraria TaxID=364024 RepID=UPI00240F0083|nr:AP2/ERF and B3 domain-containing transcription factor At1g51120 [Prosopis cineraria]